MQVRCVSSCYTQQSFKSIQRNLARYLPHPEVDVLQLPAHRCLMVFENPLSIQPGCRLPVVFSDRNISAWVSGRVSSEMTLDTPVWVPESMLFIHLLRQKRHDFALSQIIAENTRTSVTFVLAQYFITKSYARSFYSVFLLQCVYQ